MSLTTTTSNKKFPWGYRGTCHLVDMFGPPKFMWQFWYTFSGILFLFILGKRHMETNVIKM